MFIAPIRPAPLPLLHCSYSEAAYFDGYHFQHIADWQEAKRLARIRTRRSRRDPTRAPR